MALGPGIPNRPLGNAPAADEVLQRALAALNSQRPQEAEQIAGGVLKRNPRHARALHIYGCALLMQGRAKDAIAPLQDAARARHDPEIDTQLAIALRQSGRLDDALSRLKRAIKRQPPYPAAFHELGFLLHSMQRHDEAIEALKRGLEIAPMMPDLSVQLGNIFLARADHANARAAFGRALAIAPGRSDAHFGIAMAYAGDGQYAAAVEHFRSCLMGRPGDAGVLLNLGHCLLRLGQQESGYECFRAAGRGDQRRYGQALASLVKSGRGRFWLKPSDAARFMRGEKS
jgi:tetratricopeptide (TPR) repeat protein